LLSAPLTFDLSTKHGRRSFPLRKGDTIRVARGDFTGTEGKIRRLDTKNHRIYIEGVTREKADGTTSFVSIHPSKVAIVRLNLDDKWRTQRLSQKMSAEEAAEKTSGVQ